MTKQLYTPPIMTVVEIEPSHMLAGSITGGAPDSDDSEFSAPTQRRDAWGNLWNK